MEEIKNTLLRDLSLLKESEDHIEFKEAKRNFNWDGGDHKDPKERRHCILGYVVALANERGGRLVFGMKDDMPHEVVGTSFEEGNLGALEDAKKVVLQGLDGYIVSEKNGQILVCKRSEEQRIREFSAQ